jgi:hypothetical protein
MSDCVTADLIWGIAVVLTLSGWGLAMDMANHYLFLEPRC